MNTAPPIEKTQTKLVSKKKAEPPRFYQVVLFNDDFTPMDFVIRLLIDIFNMDGSLYRRFATQGALNSPWGMVETESQGRAEHLLVGNFGDGHINVYTTDGNYLGQLANQSKPLAIPGLWALAFNTGAEKEFEHDGGGLLYFTAGPDQENHGLFGYLRFNAAVVKPGIDNTVISTKVTAPPATKLPH